MALYRATRARWRFVTGLALLGVLTLGAWQVVAQEADDSGTQSGSDEAAVAAESRDEIAAAKLPDGVVDVTDKLSVTVLGKLRSTSRTQHVASILIKNTSDEDLAGRLVVVVDETGVDALSLAGTDGQLKTGQAYTEIVAAEKTLKAGAALRGTKIEFTSDDVLRADARAGFELKIRILFVPGDETSLASDEKLPGKSYSQRDFDRVVTVQERVTMPFLKRGNGDIYGTAVAENRDGDLVVQVYTQRSSLKNDLPADVDGIPVEVMTIGAPYRFGFPKSRLIYENGKPKLGKGKAGTPVAGPSEGAAPRFSGPGGDPTIRFPRPVPIGVSISNAGRLFPFDPADDPFCYSGTLGCRCVDPLGNEFVLTNNHVGGGLVVPPDGDIPVGFVFGFIGEPIVQPATGDGFCALDPNDIIGTLADFQFTVTTTLGNIVSGDFIPISVMDAAIIAVGPGMVSFDTPDDGYDAPQRTIINQPRLGDRVQKYGRTTLYSYGTITGLNVASVIAVGAEDSDGFAWYIKQYAVSNITAGGAAFGGPGDSGSLIVMDAPGKSYDRQPFALLFAGGPSGFVDSTLANPLGSILARFNLMIDDGSGAPFQAGTSGTMGGALGPLNPGSRQQ